MRPLFTQFEIQPDPDTPAITQDVVVAIGQTVPAGDVTIRFGLSLLFSYPITNYLPTTLERGLPDEVEVRCVTLHPTQPGVVFTGTQAGPYRSTDAGDTWERMHFPGDEQVVWSFEIHPADARVMYVGTQDMCSLSQRGRWRALAAAGGAH